MAARERTERKGVSLFASNAVRESREVSHSIHIREARIHIPSTAIRSRAITTDIRSTRIHIRADATRSREIGIYRQEIASYSREIAADRQEMAVNSEEIASYARRSAAAAVGRLTTAGLRPFRAKTTHFSPLQPAAQ